MSVGGANLDHVLTTEVCVDPDCELHYPEVIETDSERLTALAWFFAGAQAMGKMLEQDPEVTLLDLIARRLAGVKGGEDDDGNLHQ